MLKKIRVLVADDDLRLQSEMREKLQNYGYDVITANNGFEAIEQSQAQEPDLVLLDVLMPKMDGFQVLQVLRESTQVPVIMLSCNKIDAARIKGLNMGADDYMTKPFNFEELRIRIAAVLHRTSPLRTHDNNDTLNIGDMVVDFRTHSLTTQAGSIVYFTLIEWKLLMELVLNPGKLIEYERLLVNVWGSQYQNDIQLLRTWISRLRKKIEGDAGKTLIKTIRKTGYIFEMR